MYNTINSTLVLALVLGCATAVCIALSHLKTHKWLIVSIILAFILGVVPLFYLAFITIHWLCIQREIGQRVMKKLIRWIRKDPRQMVVLDSEESLPDRLINPAEYEEDMSNPAAAPVKDNTDQSSGHPSTANNNCETV